MKGKVKVDVHYIKSSNRVGTRVQEDEKRKYSSEVESLDNLIHEFKTPLTSIIGFAQLLIEENASELNKDQKYYIEIIHKNGQKLLNLVGNILSSIYQSFSTGEE